MVHALNAILAVDVAAQKSLSPLVWAIMALIIIIGVPFTLWWWKVADKWADSEHKRFKPTVDTRERVVIKTSPPADSPPT